MFRVSQTEADQTVIFPGPAPGDQQALGLSTGGRCNREQCHLVGFHGDLQLNYMSESNSQLGVHRIGMRS